MSPSERTSPALPCQHQLPGSPVLLWGCQAVEHSSEGWPGAVGALRRHSSSPAGNHSSPLDLSPGLQHQPGHRAWLTPEPRQGGKHSRAVPALLQALWRPGTALCPPHAPRALPDPTPCSNHPGKVPPFPVGPPSSTCCCTTPRQHCEIPHRPLDFSTTAFAVLASTSLFFPSFPPAKGQPQAQCAPMGSPCTLTCHSRAEGTLGRHGHCWGMTTSLPWLRSLCAIGRSPEEPHGHSLALWSSPHPAPRQGSPDSPAALVSSGSGPPGSTCTRSWVRRRTQEPKVALRPVARWGSSTLSRYSLSSQPRGLTPSASARPSTLRARSLCLGHGTGGSRTAQGTWAGDALHQGVHQGLPERPAQCLGCLVVRKEAVGKALLVLQRPVQSATASGQHRVPRAAELPWESRAQGWLPALPLPRHDGSLALLAPSSQRGPLDVPGTCPQWPLGPSQPLPNVQCPWP